jgi:hypothetical protein
MAMQVTPKLLAAGGDSLGEVRVCMMAYVWITKCAFYNTARAYTDTHHTLHQVVTVKKKRKAETDNPAKVCMCLHSYICT